jgi:hypothetical protein
VTLTDIGSVSNSVRPFWVMSYLYELLGSKDANGRKLLIGQPKPLAALRACVLQRQCKGRGSIHASSHGLSAGGTRLPGRVDRRPRGMDPLRGITRDPCSWTEQMHMWHPATQ